MGDNLTKEQRSYCMSRIRGANTKPELEIRKIIWHMGFRYRLHVNHLPGKPDLVLAKYRTVIFVHGCFWHHHSNCSRSFMPKSNKRYWLNKIHGNVERDKTNEIKLEKLGWRVITVWECEVYKKKPLLKRLLLKKLSIN